MPTTPARHLLLVVRHAEAGHGGSSDAERRLTAQGRVDAELTGEWLARKGIRAHGALVSSATRTRQTWEQMALAAEWDVEADFDRALYEAGTDSALDLVRLASESLRTVVVVGHNPTMASLAMLLDDGEGDDDATDAMTRGFPPCGVAAFTFDVPWQDLDAGTARLRAFHVPTGR